MAMKVTNIQDVTERKRVTELFRGAGWDLNKPRGEPTSPAGGPTIYICDVETGRLYAVGTVVDAFERLTETYHRSGFTYQDICDSFGSLVGDLSTDEVSFDPDNQNSLAAGAVLYIAGTQSYEVAKSMRFPHPQFIVLRYRDQRDGSHLLRPMPLSSPKPLTPQEIERLAQTIIETDKKNHPDRFKSAKILPFVIKQRYDI